MKNFLMICYVAVDFVGPGGEIFRIGPKQLGVFVEAPEWVKNTLIFKLLLKDESIRIGESNEAKKLENDPYDGIGADGKATEVKVEVPEPVIKTRKKVAKKKDDAE